MTSLIRLPSPLILCAILPAVALFSAEPAAGPVDPPRMAVLQEMHDLGAERTRLDLKKRYFEQRLKIELAGETTAGAELRRINARLGEIETRLIKIHARELGKFERVAADAVLDCSEEPQYGQPAYGIILHATAGRDIAANELLLFHAGGVYRTRGSFPRLTTTGEGWYFRPNRAIRRGDKFVVACIQDAPEEIANVKKGFMPNSDRARDPGRAYRTNVFIRAR